MDLLRSLLAGLEPVVPMGIAVLALVIALFSVNYVFERRIAAGAEKSVRRQILMLSVTLLGFLIVIVTSPLSDAQKGQLLSLIGILLSAAIALSSTTFLGNAMAGVMLRVTRGFRMGDFIRIGEHFGRVSERGIFHTEIQTEDRDLMTLPNLYLVTNPVKVIRASGTIISAEVSLGYEVSRTEVDKLLCEAGKAAELEDPFVHVVALGDFAVTYRIAGLLPQVKQVISARSRLRKMMLDKLHAGAIEIVSPNFMNTRAIAENRTFLPKAVPESADVTPEVQAESIAFDKAEEAESHEKLVQRHDDLVTQLEELEKQLKEESTEEGKERLTRQVDNLRQIRDRIAVRVQQKTEELEG